MEFVNDIGQFLVLAQETAEHGGAEGGGGEEEGGSFLVSPGLGLMIWTLIFFLATMWLLSKVAFPRIQEALDKRAKAIAESLDAAERSKQESEQLVAAARRDIEAETRRSLERIRKEVADLTVLTTEKVARKSLSGEDHRRLVDEALSEVDFSELSGNGEAR